MSAAIVRRRSPVSAEPWDSTRGTCEPANCATASAPGRSLDARSSPRIKRPNQIGMEKNYPQSGATGCTQPVLHTHGLSTTRGIRKLLRFRVKPPASLPGSMTHLRIPVENNKNSAPVLHLVVRSLEVSRAKLVSLLAALDGCGEPATLRLPVSDGHEPRYIIGRQSR